jgi:hypothetical protein
VTRPLFVHLGCSKTGTSSLQVALRRSVEQLAAQGVGQPFVRRSTNERELLGPLGWRAVTAFAHPEDPAGQARIVETLRATPGERLLITCEDLAEATPAVAGRLAELAAAADLELHLVLTVRGWADQLPSEFQQFLKHRMTLGFPAFLEAVRDRDGEWAERFWRRQDPARVLASWDGVVPAGRTHVVAVPPFRSDPEGVFRMMGEAVGFDPAPLRRPSRAVNASYGVVEAELWRRVNQELEGQLPHFQHDYGRAIRFPFVRAVLPREASARITLPPEHLPWVEEYQEQAIAHLAAGGYVLHGDLGTMRPRPGVAAPLTPVSDAELAQAAIVTLSRLAVHDLARLREVEAEGRRAVRAAAGASPRRSVLARAWGRLRRH